MVNIIYRTIGTTGSHYLTPQDWEVDTRKDLVAADERHIGLIQYTGQSVYPAYSGLYGGNVFELTNLEYEDFSGNTGQTPANWDTVETHADITFGYTGAGKIGAQCLSVNWTGADDNPDTSARARWTVNLSNECEGSYRRIRFAHKYDENYAQGVDHTYRPYMFRVWDDETGALFILSKGNVGDNNRFACYYSPDGTSTIENSTDYGTLIIGQTYYYELRIYPGPTGVGGADLLFFNDQYYTGEIADLRRSWIGYGNKSTTIGMLDFTSTDTMDLDMSGRVHYANISIDDIYVPTLGINLTGDHNLHQSGVFSDGFTGTSLSTDWTSVETHGDISVSGNSLHITWLNAGDPDTVAYAYLTHAALTTAPDYRRYRFSVTVDGGWSHIGGNQVLVSVRVGATYRAAIFLSVPNDHLILAKYRPYVAEGTSGGSFVLGTTYYIEIRLRPEEPTGNVDFLFYTDANYTTQVAALTREGVGSGWDDPLEVDRLYLGETQAITRQAAGTITYGPVQIVDVYESNTDITRYRQLMAVGSNAYDHVSKSGAFLDVSGATLGVYGGEDYFRLGPGIGLQSSTGFPWAVDLGGSGIILNSVVVPDMNSGENGIYLHGTSGHGAIINTVIYGNNFQTGIATDENTFLWHNTVYSISGESIGVTGSYIRNCVVFTKYGGSGASGDYNISNSLVEASEDLRLHSVTGKHPIHQFVNYAAPNQNLHVKSRKYSDIVDAGVNIPFSASEDDLTEFEVIVHNLLASDIEGKNRNTDGNPTVGAFEFSGATPVVSNQFGRDDFLWYEAEHTPNNFTGIVGGTGSITEIISGPLDLLPQITGSGEYYRKAFVRSFSEDDMLYPRVYLSNVEYRDHIAIALEKTSGDFVTGSTAIPPGYTRSDFIYPYTYSGGLQYDSVPSSGDIGVWVRYTVTGEELDLQAGFKMILEGL